MRKPEDGPEDVDAAFAEIVADLRRDGVGVQETEVVETPKPNPEPEPAPQPKPEPGPASTWRTAESEWDWESADDDEHYEPPEPPPLPRLHKGTLVAIVLIIIALVLFIVPGVLGMQSSAAYPIATISVIGAAALLLLRLRTDNPPGSPGSDDDGAQV